MNLPPRLAFITAIALPLVCISLVVILVIANQNNRSPEESQPVLDRPQP